MLDRHAIAVPYQRRRNAAPPQISPLGDGSPADTDSDMICSQGDSTAAMSAIMVHG